MALMSVVMIRKLQEIARIYLETERKRLEKIYADKALPIDAGLS